MNKVSIKSLSITELNKFVEENKQPKFRAQQILEWLYGKYVDSFESMTNLPKDFIEVLSRNFVIEKAACSDLQKSKDGTIKYLLQLNTQNSKTEDSILVETVAIPSKKEGSNRLTLCISSQAGCSMGCKFCATGQQGFSRNLFMGEILEQVLFVSNNLKSSVSNIVVMGQGEPFLNFENLVDALSVLNNPKCLNIGARKITVSTCGILQGIRNFAKVDKQYGLAISLHSAIQNKRDKLMPGAKNFNLDALRLEIVNYIDKTNRRISFEYLMIQNFNDDEEDLIELKNFCKGLLCHINLIKLNEVPNSKFTASNSQTIKHWLNELNNFGIETTLRDSRGADIDAACGQLLHNK